MRILIVVLIVTVCAVARADEPQFGTLKGRFVYDGEAPQAKPLIVDKDPIFCGKQKLFDETLIVDPKTRGIANIVIELLAEKPPKHANWDKLIAQPLELKQENCRYEPHICLVLTQQELNIVNRDDIGHNPKIDVLGNRPNSDLIPAGRNIQKRFQLPERLPVSISCSIHPWMKGYIVVHDHPYVAITNAQGEFSIKDLPPGEWTFRVWQERAGFIRQVVRDNVAQEWPKGRFTVTIKPGDHDLGEMKISPKTFKE